MAKIVGIGDQAELLSRFFCTLSGSGRKTCIVITVKKRLCETSQCSIAKMVMEGMLYLYGIVRK